MDSVARLGHVEVLDIWGKPVFFRDLWQGKTTVVVFVRHFGCLYCHEHASTVVHAKNDIEAAGGSLLLLGHGNPVHAGQFSRQVGLEGLVFTDPARILYRALGMKHGILRVYNLESSRHMARATRAGFKNRGVLGDRWQLGGTVVLDARGTIVYRHVSQIAGDHGSVSDVLFAVRRQRHTDPP
jgi:peroxiredoxin